MHVNGYALAAAVLAGALVWWCWHHRLGARIVSVGIALTAVFAVIAIPAWRDALAGVFGTGPGMVALVILTFAGLGSFLVHHIRGGHHPVWTSAFGVVGATCGVLAWAMAPELGHQGSRIGPQVAAAMGQATAQIRSGHAAASQSPSQRAMVITVALLVFVVLIYFAHRSHQRRKFRQPRPLAALTSGRPAPLAPGSPVAPGAPRRSLLGGRK